MERQVYKCSNCGGMEFEQTVKEEFDKIYNSIEHTVTKGMSVSVGSAWTCTNCSKFIHGDLLHDIFPGVKLKGYKLLDLSKKNKGIRGTSKRVIG